MKDRDIEKYFEISETLGGKASNWKYYFSILFDDFDFVNSNVLDIGGGFGRLSYYAAAKGAKKVKLLEPESDGSNSKMIQAAKQYQIGLEAHRVVEVMPIEFQDFSPDETCSFDLVILERSVNHLNEMACKLLNDSKSAHDEYIRLFEKINGIMSAEGRMIIVDCSNRNFFGDLGIKNPFAKTIEWEIHQSPHTWAVILQRCGFKTRRIT